MLPCSAKGALPTWLNLGYQNRKIIPDNTDMANATTKILINKKKRQENWKLEAMWTASRNWREKNEFSPSIPIFANTASSSPTPLQTSPLQNNPPSPLVIVTATMGNESGYPTCINTRPGHMAPMCGDQLILLFKIKYSSWPWCNPNCNLRTQRRENCPEFKVSVGDPISKRTNKR